MKGNTRQGGHGVTLTKEQLIDAAFKKVRSRFIFIAEEMDSLFDEIKELDARLKGEKIWWEDDGYL